MTKKLLNIYFCLVGQLGRIFKVFEDLGAGGAKGKRPMPHLVLYHFQLSPYALRVRMAAKRLKLDIPQKEVLLDDQAWRELVKQGGRDRVPCLRIQSGTEVQWMYESKAIVRYLENLK